VTMESDSFSISKFNVFLRYQTIEHREPKSRWSQADFKRFLCSGLNRKTVREGSKEQKLGSYHQCYWLDGKLIAVAVLDLLPHAVSSVYVFYDPDFGEWEFGKLSAMREISLTLEGGYQYYYMGFYIHSCQKMRYKATFQPQFMLDPQSLTWDQFDEELRQKLDKRPYVSLSQDRALAAQAAPKNSDETEAPSTAVNRGGAGLVKSDKVDSEISDDTDMSLFDVNMPGVLTRQELEDQVDLDHWLLVAHGVLVEMIDLVAWETSNIEDPQAIKGIVGELAAALGPKVVKNSAVVLF